MRERLNVSFILKVMALYNVCFVLQQVAFYMKDTERMYLCLSQERIIQFQVGTKLLFETQSVTFVSFIESSVLGSYLFIYLFIYLFFFFAVNSLSKGSQQRDDK